MVKKADAAPEGLTAGAASRWAEVFPILAKRGPVDRDLLKTYCEVWARWQKAEGDLAKTSALVKSGGRIVASPLIGISTQASGQLRSLEKKLQLDAVEDVSPVGLLTRREVSEAMGVHMQTICKWERDGMPIEERGRKGKPSLYRLVDVKRWMVARENAAKSGDVVDVAQERARKERAQAVLAEQTFQMRGKKLLPAEEVDRWWSAEVAAVRAIILASYTTHADRVHRASTLSGLPGVEKELKELAYAVLRELADPDRGIGEISA